ncbi:MAG: arsenic resistance protein [Candidatus Heimdallarchaeota archaeon]|nr:arsenic resistance protein [Candidatus Heimdallarchaeota archaeon]MCG3254623.1 arsenic resistance protein [Candidatus Heimdallarchaeota archaeon]MCK4609705.1 arsenic resistance protein [Candidatus Heimdallarchaeota archaeon]
MSNSVETSQIEEDNKKYEGLGLFEKLLPIWIVICMATGILLSLYAPSIAETIDSWQVRGISIPIGICLFFMMYPAMLNLKALELKKLAKNPKPIILTLVSNWIIAPFVGWGFARLFLPGNEQLMFAIILLSSSPCTAMVLVWGYLADGNQEQNVITTSLNTITIIIGYAPMVALLSGISNISIDVISLIISVAVFIGIPLILGVISRALIIKAKGEEWFKSKYIPIVGKISILALLTTLVVLFSLNGNVMISNFNLLLLVSVPLLLGFIIVVGYNLLITRFTKLAYREGVITVIIGSSSHFEIAIATAIAMYGVGSVAALGTTMGLFWEIPIMIGLVYLAKFLKKKHWWKGTPM